MRVVLDTCVWVSAVRSRRGASFALLSEIPHGRFQFGISVPLFFQCRAKLLDACAERVTALSQAQVEAILAALAHYGEPVTIFFRLRPNLRDENDNMVFECAANYGAEYIVTHNVRDFSDPELRGYAIEAVEPGRFIDILRREP
jgi:putative PIN family toxin of toxin-antitoxin system